MALSIFDIVCKAVSVGYGRRVGKLRFTTHVHIAMYMAKGVSTDDVCTRMGFIV